MIKMPDDLVETARLVGYTPIAINEDKLTSLAKSWGVAEKTFKNMVDQPMKAPGSVWDPTTTWERGNDRPLDAFTDFWENYPRKHFHTVAAQGPVVAGALNNIAGIIAGHKKAAYETLKSTKDVLSRGGHMLGGAYHTVLFFHVKGESESDVDTDSAAINAAMDSLKKLNQHTQDLIDAQVKIITAATSALDGVSDNATKTTGALPGGSDYAKSTPDDYQYWVSSGGR
ncbi:hypothetical protein [Actinoallomurus sp. CA-142502]|uniref:hypothetical protein n=1 Tax=Actinoallomurus sp. CA-142502 TaxID=3239885 RepID=UPI003D8EB30C